jgi:hypothetical protein
VKVDTKVKLAALWAATTFCYIYGDYFELYMPGALNGILNGQMGPLGRVTQQVLLATSMLMAIPSVLVFLSLAIRPAINRWINVGFGSLFTVIMTMIVLQDSWMFYKFFALVEILLTSTIVRLAWKWPRTA